MTNRGSRQGFTIVELLVVIAIIAILAAILYPVYGAARERARMVSCQSNCRQVYLAFRMYTQDWEKFPPVMGETTGKYFSVPQYLTAYAKEEGVFRCPSDTWSLWPMAWMFPGKATAMTPWGQCAVLESGLYTEVGTSYIWNFALAGEAPEVDRTLDSQENVSPGYVSANLFWAYDSCRNHLGGGRSWSEGSSQRSILFADGHVEMANRERSVAVFRANGLNTRSAW